MGEVTSEALWADHPVGCTRVLPEDPGGREQDRLVSHLQSRQDTGRGNTRFCPGPTGYWEEGHEGLASTSFQKTSNAARQGDSPGELCHGLAAAGMLQSNGAPFSLLHVLGQRGEQCLLPPQSCTERKGETGVHQSFVPRNTVRRGDRVSP